eukprot:scaffold7066_cov253-Pinguiococcus_pyrenoidosus.AAC.38
MTPRLPPGSGGGEAGRKSVLGDEVGLRDTATPIGGFATRPRTTSPRPRPRPRPRSSRQVLGGLRRFGLVLGCVDDCERRRRRVQQRASSGLRRVERSTPCVRTADDALPCSIYVVLRRLVHTELDGPAHYAPKHALRSPGEEHADAVFFYVVPQLLNRRLAVGIDALPAEHDSRAQHVQRSRECLCGAGREGPVDGTGDRIQRLASTLLFRAPLQLIVDQELDDIHREGIGEVGRVACVQVSSLLLQRQRTAAPLASGAGRNHRLLRVSLVAGLQASLHGLGWGLQRPVRNVGEEDRHHGHEAIVQIHGRLPRRALDIVLRGKEQRGARRAGDQRWQDPVVEVIKEPPLPPAHFRQLHPRLHRVDGVQNQQLRRPRQATSQQPRPKLRQVGSASLGRAPGIRRPRRQRQPGGSGGESQDLPAGHGRVSGCSRRGGPQGRRPRRRQAAQQQPQAARRHPATAGTGERPRRCPAASLRTCSSLSAAFRVRLCRRGPSGFPAVTSPDARGALRSATQPAVAK